MDLTDPVSMETVVEEAIQAFGHIDILLLAAGVLQIGFFKDISSELDKHIMDVNYSGQRELIRTVLPSEPMFSAHTHTHTHTHTHVCVCVHCVCIFISVCIVVLKFYHSSSNVEGGGWFVVSPTAH